MTVESEKVINNNLYNLGRKQAQLGLPLAFLDTMQMGNTPSKTRSDALALCTNFLNQLGKYIINEYKTAVTPSNLKYFLAIYLMSHNPCIATSFKTSGKTDITYNTDVLTLDKHYIETVFNYYNDMEHNTVPERIFKAIDKFDFSQTDADAVEYLKLKAPRIDIQKAKVVVPRTPLNVISLIPMPMLEGYIQQLALKAQNELLELHFLKANGISRKIYYTLDSTFLKNIYHTDISAKETLEISQPNYIRYFGAFSQQDIDRGTLTGFLSLPDVGTYYQQEVMSTMRKVNLTTLTEVKSITDANSKEVNELALYSNVDLDRVFESLIQYTSALPKENIKDAYKLITTDAKTVRIKTDIEDIDNYTEALIKYINYYQMLDESQAKKVLYKIMLDNKELFNKANKDYITIDVLNPNSTPSQPKPTEVINIATETNDFFNF